MAIGGRHYRGNSVDQNFDAYAVEYTYPDGTKLFFDGRNMPGVPQRIRQLRPRVERLGRGLDLLAHAGPHAHLQGPEDPAHGDRAEPIPHGRTLVWAFPQPELSPYDWEWDDLIAAIREDKPYNEVKRGAEASLVASMGRMAAHTGQLVTFDQMLNREHEFAPDVDKLTLDGPAPLRLGPDGKYPVPQPGIKKTREY